jgi:hypothetical protein
MPEHTIAEIEDQVARQGRGVAARGEKPFAQEEVDELGSGERLPKPESRHRKISWIFDEMESVDATGIPFNWVRTR